MAEFMQKSVMAPPQIVRMVDASLIKSSAILITPRFGSKVWAVWVRYFKVIDGHPEEDSISYGVDPEEDLI